MVGWMKLSLGTEVGLSPGDIVLDGNPDLPTERGTAPATFRPMSVVAKRSSISATADSSCYIDVSVSTRDLYQCHDRDVT